MEVHRNLRTPKARSSRMRMVRIVGDGTPENTKILDGSGQPLEELVTSYSVQGDGNGCARGVFVFTEIDSETGNFVMDEDSGEPLEGTFEAWVLFEQPVDLMRKSQLDRLAAFIIEHVPGEPSEDEGAVDTAIRLLRNHVPIPVEGERYWSCKIGPAPRGSAPRAALDYPMRTAVKAAFRGLYGVDASEITSGWDAHLTQGERRAAESFADGTPRDGKKEEGLEDGGIGTPTGPELERAADAPADAFAEPRDGGTKEFKQGGGWEAPVTQEELESLKVETGEAAFSRLAPGGGLSKKLTLDGSKGTVR